MAVDGVSGDSRCSPIAPVVVYLECKGTALPILLF